jgi:hypothetical protein
METYVFGSGAAGSLRSIFQSHDFMISFHVVTIPLYMTGHCSLVVEFSRSLMIIEQAQIKN